MKVIRTADEQFESLPGYPFEPNYLNLPDVVRQLTAGKGFLFSDLGEVVPKGFEEPVRLWEVRWQEEAQWTGE